MSGQATHCMNPLGDLQLQMHLPNTLHPPNMPFLGQTQRQLHHRMQVLDLPGPLQLNRATPPSLTTRLQLMGMQQAEAQVTRWHSLAQRLSLKLSQPSLAAHTLSTAGTAGST